MNSPGFEADSSADPFGAQEPDFVGNVMNEQAEETRLAREQVAGDPYAFFSQPDTQAQPVAMRPVAHEAQSATDPPQEPPPPQAAKEAPVSTPEDQLSLYKAQVEAMSPLLGRINADPALAQVVFREIERYMSGQTAQETAPPSDPEPQIPDRPGDFDPSDQFVPGTSSFAYREAVENARYAKAEWRAKQAEQVAARAMETLERQAIAEEQRKKMAAAAYSISEKRGVSLDVAREYIDFISNEQVKEEDLWEFFQARRAAPAGGGALPQQPESPTLPLAAQKAGQMNDRNQRLQFPVPSAIAGGQGGATVNPSDMLFNSILSGERKRDPFSA